MALDTVPWFIGGGAEHSPAVARMLAYSATNGANGVNTGVDLKVTALPTPGAAVRIMPGGASLVNRYPGGGQQSYTLRNATATDVPVPATGSASGSNRYVIIRIDDPEYGGAVPANVKTGPYVRALLVDSITNLAYPFIALARITQPANTATITQAMIADLRKVANPRRESFTRMGIPTAGKTMASSSGAVFPDYRASVEVPEWANEVSLVAMISGMAVTGGATYGEMAVTLGPFGSAQFRSANGFYDIEAATSAEQRQTLIFAGQGTVPDALRGTTQQVGTEMRRIDGPGSLVTRRGTQVIYTVEFTETPS